MPRRAVPLAGTDLIRTLPRYRRLVRRRRAWGVLLGAGGALAAGCGIALSMQPATAHQVTSAPLSRDVMLCLDVSGSMSQTDVPALRELGALSARLHGDRVGLTIFDSAAQSIFPLTDDAAYAQRQLSTAASALARSDVTFLTGTIPRGSNDSSLVSDGLVSCLQRFDHPQVKRARSVVLVSDNEAGSGAVYTLAQAVDLARRHRVRVYAIWPRDPLAPRAGVALRAEVERTGGRFYLVSDPFAVSAIVRQVQRLDATSLRSSPQVAHTDEPAPFWLAGCAGLLLVLLATGQLRR